MPLPSGRCRSSRKMPRTAALTAKVRIPSFLTSNPPRKTQTAQPQVQYRPRPPNLSLERIMKKSAARNPSDASQGPRGTIPPMAGHTRGYAQRIDVAADLQRVWRALTNTEDLTRWCSPAATISARPGGLFRASVDRVTELDAHIDIFEPGRRLRLIYLPTPSLPPSESAVVDDFILDADDDGTVM